MVTAEAPGKVPPGPADGMDEDDLTWMVGGDKSPVKSSARIDFGHGQFDCSGTSGPGGPVAV